MKPVTGISSGIYKFGQDYLLRLAVDGVPAADPFHLVGGFEGFGHVFLFHHRRFDELQPFNAGAVDLGEVFHQGSAENKVGIQCVTVFLQVSPPHNCSLFATNEPQSYVFGGRIHPIHISTWLLYHKLF